MDRSSTPLLVACLCARWCGSCRDYTATFEQAGAGLGERCRFVWIDIEDDAALVDGVDVDDFPTLLIARADRLLFFGPITPHPQTVTRLVASALAGELKLSTTVDAPTVSALEALVQRLAARG